MRPVDQSAGAEREIGLESADPTLPAGGDMMVASDHVRQRRVHRLAG